MPVRLLSLDLAAQEWGWYEDMVFTKDNQEEFLRELLFYLNSKKSSFRWKAQPNYTFLLHNRRTGELDNSVRLRGLRVGRKQLIPFGHWNWYFSRISPPIEEMIVFDRHYLCAVEVPFNSNMREARIEYMIHDTKGFYYITIYDWIARCSEPSECMTLLNAVDPVPLYDDWIYRTREYRHFRHLEQLPCHDDPPRRAYIQRNMEAIVKRYEGYEWELLGNSSLEIENI